MKYLFNLCLIVVTLNINVTTINSQLFQQKVNCKTFGDPVNCNAYYECCVDNVILHKFCPAGMEWVQSERSCERRNSNGEGCQNDGMMLNDVERENEIAMYLETKNNTMQMLPTNARRPIRPPRPPISGSVEIKLNGTFTLMLLMLMFVFFEKTIS